MSDATLAAAQARAEVAEAQLAQLQAQLKTQNPSTAAGHVNDNDLQTFSRIDHYRVPKLPPFS